jgi:tRNA pseudouridine55 synthase
MARQRKKKGRPISGWLILDKPVGMGSTDAVAKIKWLFSAEKAGHAGTLDPLASGMLPIALGEATKTVPYVMEGAKVYRFTVSWGEERATDDLEGVVTATSDFRPDRAAIEALLPRYTGTIQQVPPQFSAIKIAGERAYDMARDGETVDIPAREVEIERIDIIAHDGDHTEFEVECGKGTYVRSLARDFGRELGCFGHVSALRRTEVYPFVSSAMVPLDDLTGPVDAIDPEAEPDERVRARNAIVDPYLQPTGSALDSLPRVTLNDEQATRVRLGNPVLLIGRDAPTETDEACAFARGRLVAIGEIGEGQFKPRRVFTL